MPEGLDVTYFLNSGSEANDLAVTMARAFTGNVACWPSGTPITAALRRDGPDVASHLEVHQYGDGYMM